MILQCSCSFCWINRLTLVSHCCSFSFLSLASALCFSSSRCLASVAASMSLCFKFNVTSRHNLGIRRGGNKSFCESGTFLFFLIMGGSTVVIKSSLICSPSRLVVQLVFQLSHFLLDDPYPSCVYKHSVLLKTKQSRKFIHN